MRLSNRLDFYTGGGETPLPEERYCRVNHPRLQQLSEAPTEPELSLELIDIALAERQPHPRLQDRVTGKVRAILTENVGGREIRHELMVPVWLDVHAGMSEEDIELGLMVKAADIVGRLKQHLPDTESEG